MANEFNIPEELQNGPGNWPDAEQLMMNFRFLNDKVWKGATPPPDPNKSPIWIKTDEPVQTAIRIYFGSNWYAIMIGGVVG